MTRVYSTRIERRKRGRTRYPRRTRHRSIPAQIGSVIATIIVFTLGLATVLLIITAMIHAAGWQP